MPTILKLLQREYTSHGTVVIFMIIGTPDILLGDIHHSDYDLVLLFCCYGVYQSVSETKHFTDVFLKGWTTSKSYSSSLKTHIGISEKCRCLDG